MMSTTQLQDYKNWVGASALTVRDSAKQQGGWAKVFPKTVPMWASRVRNYFNEIPTALKLLPEAQRRKLADDANKFRKLQGLSKAEIAERMALSGTVYEDRDGRRWYEMDPGGAIYHYKGNPSSWKAVKASSGGQANCPVFKLVSPPIQRS